MLYKFKYFLLRACSGTLSSIVPVVVNTLNTVVAGINRVTCINSAITAITLATTGATGVTVSGLPTGVTGSWAGNVVTINGTPTVSGIFNYTFTTTGGCTLATTTGTITVNALTTITSVAANETCASLNNGTIGSVNISGGVSKVRYIRLKHNQTDGEGWLHPAELKAFEIFGGDVAAGKTAISSAISYAGGSYPASNLVDGSLGTIYHSSGTGPSEWVEIDLGQEYSLDRIQIWTGNCCFTARFNDLQLILRDNGGNVVSSRQINLNNGSGVATDYVFNVLDVSWSDGATTLNRSALDAGSYTLNYTDITGCSTLAHTKVIGTTNPN